MRKTRAEASTLEKQVIALATRPKKERLTAHDRRVLMEHWKEKSRAAAIDYAAERGAPRRDEPSPARESIEYAVAHLTERQSVMVDSMLMTAAMQHAVGRATHDELRAELNRRIAAGDVIAERALYRPASEGDGSPARNLTQLEAEARRDHGFKLADAARRVEESIRKGALVPVEARYTTALAWRTEQSILRLEREGRRRLAPVMTVGRAEEALSRTNLNRGQRAAALAVLTTSNRVIGIQGSAGVGKSHLIGTAAAIAEREGYRVAVLAPYANQVERLQADGLKASTLATFLASKEKDIDERTVVVIDEAGLVPTREMEAALQAAERHRARVVLSGDIQQLKAVEAGRPFAQLQANGMRTATVDEIQRQKTPDLKPAVELAAKGRARTLIVSGTNAARRELNALVRQELGIEGRGREFETLSRKDSTQAERRHAPSYRIGEFVQPEKDYPQSGLRRGELYRVAEIETRNRLVLEREDGSRFEINPCRYAHLSVYEKVRSELAPGDWARITRNDPALDVSNGDRVRVVEVQENRIKLENERGRYIELEASKPLHLEHAYATTVHSAQGLTTDRMMVDLDTRSLTTGKDLYYVAISRARYEATIYTNSRAELPAAISREAVKTAALDIQKEQRWGR